MEINEWKEMCERIRSQKEIKNKKFTQGYFVPKNWKKCLNVTDTNTPVIYRSSWECDFMNYLDNSDAFVKWGNEIIKILYPNPLTGKMSFYIPDFYIEYVDVNKVLHKELIEVKPRNQASIKHLGNVKDKLEYVKNLKKWESAIKYCQHRNIKFRVLTETELYRK